MKTKILILILVCFNISFLYAQREAGIWYFGFGAGINFNSGTPVALTNGSLKTEEGCATFSDEDGNLLFYTDGISVWNRQHRIMPNGYDLLGDPSSTQSAIIVPNPSNPNSYYIFTVDQPRQDGDGSQANPDGKNDGLNYSEVNMNLNGGLGDVNPAKKNIHLLTYNPNNSKEAEFKCSEKITAVQHNDGISYWVITYFLDSFYSFKITKSGVQNNPIISNTPNLKTPLEGYLHNAQGYLKSSPNGKKLAIAHGATKNILNDPKTGRIIRNTGKAFLYDFNNATGAVSNQLSLLSGENPYGVEFSSKSKKLYINSNEFDSENNILGSTLYQFDLESSDIAASKTQLGKKSDYSAGALQLAIDEKIYIAGILKTPAIRVGLSVINNPEADASSCTFSEFYLAGKKPKLGLPPFIQSLFLFNFKYEFTCFGDSTHFSISTVETIDSVLWDFGDGTTSTDIDAYHIYGAPGTYNVSLTKTTDGETKDPIVKEVIIYEKPLILNTTYQLIQCDSYDSNPNDELSTFNLENSIAELTLNKADDFNVYFYLNDTDAKNDLYNENPLTLIYKNTIPNQILTAKVMYKDSDCFSLGKVELIANSSLLLDASDFIGCDIGDGTALFDFSTKENEIKSSLNLPISVIIYFYDIEENAINNVSPLGNDYISSEKIIYFRAENNGFCYGAGTFNLVVNYFPPVELNENIPICESNFPMEINAGIPFDIQQNYSYNWSNGENTYQISVAKEQQISVTITDKIIGCEKVKIFDIVKVTTPNIIDVDINLNNNTAVIITENNFDNLYVIDNPYSNYQSENTFNNVTPGLHTVYVKNKYECGITTKNIFVLGFPKFFTPNNDGVNDLWGIKGLNFEEFKYSNILIFNRFGKHLATIDPYFSWDGIYNGEFLPSNDYWFSIDVTDNENLTKTYKAHFSLIRK